MPRSASLLALPGRGTFRAPVVDGDAAEKAPPPRKVKAAAVAPGGHAAARKEGTLVTYQAGPSYRIGNTVFLLNVPKAVSDPELLAYVKGRPGFYLEE